MGNESFKHGRDHQAGQMYTQKHYGWVMFMIRLKVWLVLIGLPTFIVACYLKGR
jgi:hypothetical protein